jgi:hypothetical protein
MALSHNSVDGACPVLLQALSSDNERLRLSASAAHEAAARQADELKRLQRDNARMSSALVRLCLYLSQQIKRAVATTVLCHHGNDGLPHSRVHH